MTDKQEQSIQAPQPINPDHKSDDFDSGNADLNEWLKKRALKNEASGASRTYVVTVAQSVIAYYCLANGSVVNATAPGKVRRNIPAQIPVMVIGRLAYSTSSRNCRH